MLVRPQWFVDVCAVLCVGGVVCGTNELLVRPPPHVRDRRSRQSRRPNNMEGAELGSGYGSGEVGSSSSCEELPAWGVPLGVIMGTLGIINIGQNLQPAAFRICHRTIQQNDRSARGSGASAGRVRAFLLLNFAALAFAPASILTPLESIQFATNVAWNVTVNKRR